MLRNVGINILVYGSLVVFGAWVAGPSRAAVWVRRVSAPTMREHPIVLYGLVSLVLLAPFAWLLIASISPQVDLLQVPLKWIPSHASLSRYEAIFSSAGRTSTLREARSSSSDSGRRTSSA